MTQEDRIIIRYLIGSTVVWLLKLALALGAIGAILAAPNLLAEWLTEYALDWIWMPLFLSIPAGLLVCLWRWYCEAVEREAAEQEEGDEEWNRQNALCGRSPCSPI